jgi:predicted RNase H-like HicB family nuclease
MNHLQQNSHAMIRASDEQGYVAECVEISVVTQGKTLDEVTQNLSEAISLHLEGEDLSELSLVSQPSVSVIFK